jgi:single-stranded DNA-binding protein
MKVNLVGNLGKIDERKGDKGVFYELLVAVKRKNPVLRPDGKAMDADWFKVLTNHDCSKLKVGQYLAVEGRMVQRYWTKKDEPSPAREWVTEYEIRADKVSLVEDDTKKKAAPSPSPAIGRIMSSSLG